MSRKVPVLASVAFLFVVAAQAQAQVVREYKLYATDGYMTMQDGSKQYMFGFNDTGIKGQAMFPSPLIWANVGDEVHITLNNLGMKYRPDIMDPHTVHLHGIHLVPYFDGFPETSFAIPEGSEFTYKFKPMREGAFMYHCHQEAVEHVQMGMYGSLLIYKDDTKTLRGKSYTKEYIWLISELDSRWHRSLDYRRMPDKTMDRKLSATEQTFPTIPYAQWVRVNFRPDYWMINFLGFPDTLKTGAELPIQTTGPDGALAGLQTGIVVCKKPDGTANPAHDGLQQGTMLEIEPDQPVAIRVIHMGYQTHALHAHCTHLEIVGEDAATLPNVASWQNGGAYYPYEVYTLLTASGKTHDIIYMLHGDMMQISDALVPKPEQSPFPSATGPFYDPTAQPNGLWYWPMHCHDDYHVADQGVYPTGMLTLIKTHKLPPAP